jgi:hypothetical protein
MKNHIKSCIIALALASASSALAQPQGGDWEFTLGGGGGVDQDFEAGTGSINGSMGYFFNPNFEVAVRQSINLDALTSDEEWSGSTIVAADWHFVFGSKFVPFIGLTTGLTYTEDDSAWSVGPELGFKYYVHERTFIFLSGEYRWFFDELESIDENSDDGSFAFLVGVGFTIGGR